FVGSPNSANGFIGARPGATTNQNGQRQGANGALGGAQGGALGGQYGANGQNGQRGGQNNQNMNNRQQQGDSRSRSEMPIQTTYHIDFSVPTVAAPKIATKLSTQLTNTKTLGSVERINAEMQGEMLVLRGTVATDDD